MKVREKRERERMTEQNWVESNAQCLDCALEETVTLSWRHHGPVSSVSGRPEDPDLTGKMLQQ